MSVTFPGGGSGLNPSGVSSGPPTLIFAGDSQMADGWLGGANGTVFANRFPFWLRTYTHGRFICDLNVHVPATTGLTVATWMSTWLAATVTLCQQAVQKGSTPIVMLKIGTNDCTTPTAFSGIKANFDTIFATLAAAGAITLPFLIIPRNGGTALSANGEKLRNGINAYLASFRLKPALRVLPIDTIKVLTNGDGTNLAGTTQDGLHTTPYGAALEGKLVATLLNTLAPADVVPGYYPPTDVYDATYAPWGNVLVNGALTGTTGTLGNARVTGVAPTGFTVGGYTNALLSVAGSAMSAVGSQVFSNQGEPNEPMYQLALGGTASSECIGFQYTSGSTPGVAVAGDILQMGCDVEWDAGLANVSGIAISLNLFFQGQAFEGAGDGVGPLPSAAGRLQLVTNPLVVPVGYGNQALVLKNMVQGASGGAPSGNVRFGQMWVRKVG